MDNDILVGNHSSQSPAEVAKDWLYSYYDYFPRRLQFPKMDLEPMANYFASYLQVSFDLILDPGLKSSGACNCDLCRKLVAASHLKAKKPTKSDKREAKEICVLLLSTMAQAQGYDLTKDRIVSLMNDPILERDIAYLAYVNSVVDRMNGKEVGTYALVLWRKIAWAPTGSPIRNFKLTMFSFKEIEASILSLLKNSLD